VITMPAVGGVGPPGAATQQPRPHAVLRGRRLDVVIALLVAVPPLICVIAFVGIPNSGADWAALLGPVAAGAAVLTVRRHVQVAVALMAVVVLCVTPAEQVLAPSGSPWLDALTLTPFIALALVFGTLGSALPLVPSLLWMAGSAAIFLWALGVDVSWLLIALGWWLVGRVLRSRREVAANLRVRAAELSAERDRYTAEAVRLERTRIARELHDVVAHCMTVIVIQSRAGRHLLDSDPVAAQEALDVIVAVAAEAEADIGALVNLMDPELTRPLTRGLLDELVTRAGATGATITAEITGDPDDLDPATGVVAHRVIQEAITNAFRHAPGAAIRIELTGGPEFTIEVTNDPPLLPATVPSLVDRHAEPDGDSPGTWGSGRGLIGIRERVIGVGGEVTWGATSSGGWQVLARFPLRDRR